MKHLRGHVAGRIAASILAIGIALGQSAPADLIVTNAKVVTVDDRRPVATSFAVRNGKFVVVGSERDSLALRGANTVTINAHGRTVIPGLNDSHLHSVREARFYNLELRWDG